MRSLLRLLFFFVLACSAVDAVAQRLDDILATSNGVTYTAQSLSPEAQKLYVEQRKVLSENRSKLVSEMIVDVLLELEGKAQVKTSDKLLEAERVKVAQPTQAEIQSVYDANRNALGGKSLDEVRPQIVEFLKRNAEDKLVDKYIQSLRAKHKVVIGKDVNAVGLNPADVLATVGARSITLREFDEANRVRLNDVEMQIYESVRADLEGSIFSSLVAEDAKARNIDAGTYIATEITDKLRAFTDEERAAVEADLMQRLFTRYAVKIVMRSPTPIVHNVSADDDPVTGNAAAPVTVVMFTDYQCPACARTHPVLKQVVQAYGDKVRLVIRDFPLENIHKDAFGAALAANAAGKQGKFAEYTDILYRNQDALEKPDLVRYAGELGLNVKQFELDFSDAKTAAEVRKDQADGRTYGITGTPGIFVNGVKIYRLSFVGFRSAIERVLKK